MKLLTIAGNSVDISTEKILKFTPQLFYVKDTKQPITPFALGSGIFYKNDNTFYLITASHVYEEITPNQIGIMINSTFYILTGSLIQTDTSKSEINKNIDLAILRLDEKVVQNILTKYSFLENKDIGFKYIMTTNPKYLMVGFPVSKTKLKSYNKTLKVEPFVFLTKHSTTQKYQDVKYNIKTNIIVDINKKTKSFKSSLVHSIPDLFGVSGSGLWSISLVPPSFKLIGIMTKWGKKDSLGIGTKIDIAIQMIINNKKNITKPRSE